jgi:uncharacterized protein (UPF0332 family)
MKSKKLHAERNKELSENLLKEGVYFDWVVTTAFYSSIHFVEEYLLPCELNGKKCSNIRDVKNALNQQGRHAARERLVFHKMSELSPKYKWLDDQSRNSRYVTYKVNKAFAEKAIQFLKVIKETLEKQC